MIETTRCVNCGDEFDYSPKLSTAEDFDRFELGLDAPEFCDGCDFDPLDEMDASLE